MSRSARVYIDAHSKSQLLSFVLTFIFGPLGLFYSSAVAAIILCVIAIASMASVVGPLMYWVMAILIGMTSVSSHNNKVRAAARPFVGLSLHRPARHSSMSAAFCGSAFSAAFHASLCSPARLSKTYLMCKHVKDSRDEFSKSNL